MNLFRFVPTLTPTSFFARQKTDFLPGLSKIPRISTRDTASQEQVKAINQSLALLHDQIYNSELKNISISHSSKDIEVASPGVGDKLRPVYLAVVYLEESLCLPKAGETSSGSEFDSTRSRLDQLRTGSKNCIAIQTGTLYITGSPKKPLKDLNSEHSIKIGDITVAQAYFITSSRGPVLHYKIFGDVFVSKIMYREFIVRLPRTIQKALSKMSDHSYVMPCLLAEEPVRVIKSSKYFSTVENSTNIEPLIISEIAAD